jgi:hypothetical protein
VTEDEFPPTVRISAAAEGLGFLAGQGHTAWRNEPHSVQRDFCGWEKLRAIRGDSVCFLPWMNTMTMHKSIETSIVVNECDGLGNLDDK